MGEQFQLLVDLWLGLWQPKTYGMIKDSIASDFGRPLLKGSVAKMGVENSMADMEDGDLMLWKNFG